MSPREVFEARNRAMVMRFSETKLVLEKIRSDMEALTEMMMGAEDLLSAHHEDQVFGETDYDPPQQRK